MKHMISTAKEYASLIWWVAREALRGRAWHAALVVGLQAFGFLGELGFFLLLAQAIVAGGNEVQHISYVVALVVGLIFSYVLSYLGRVQVISYALAFERSLVPKVLRSAGPRKETLRLGSTEARYMTTTVRILMRTPVAIVAIIPIVAFLFYLSVETTIVFLFLILLLSIPIIFIGRHTSNAMEALLESGREASRHRTAYHMEEVDELFVQNDPTDIALSAYGSLLQSIERVKLVIDFMTAFGIGVVVISIFGGGIDLEVAVMYLIALRFMAGQMSIVASFFATLNRFTGTLKRVRDVISK